MKRSRDHGTNLRALGMSPRQLGTNPRALRGVRPKVKRAKKVYASGDVRRNGVRPLTRFEVLKRDGFRCQYCGADSSKAPLHVDHIVPRAKGGSNDPGNLITACADCNLGKGARPLVGGVE